MKIFAAAICVASCVSRCTYLVSAKPVTSNLSAVVSASFDLSELSAALYDSTTTNLSRSLSWPMLPYLLPNITYSNDRPEWLNFTDAGRDLTSEETLDLALIIFQQLTNWISTAWANPCEIDPPGNGDAAIRLALTCHQPTPSVLTLIIALKELMLATLSWGGKMVKYDFGLGTNYTHQAAVGTFEVIELVGTDISTE